MKQIKIDDIPNMKIGHIYKIVSENHIPFQAYPAEWGRYLGKILYFMLLEVYGPIFHGPMDSEPSKVGKSFNFDILKGTEKGTIQVVVHDPSKLFKKTPDKIYEII